MEYRGIKLQLILPMTRLDEVFAPIRLVRQGVS